MTNPTAHGGPLTAEQEADLGKRIQAAQHVAHARSQDDRGTIAADGRRALDTLVTSNLRLAYRAVNQHDPDEVGAVLEGLTRAALRYSPARGYRFSSYATWLIRAELANHRRRCTLVRVPDHWWATADPQLTARRDQLTGTPLDLDRLGDHTHPADPAAAPDSQTIVAEAHRQLADALAALPADQRELLQLRYGLTDQPWTLRRLADKRGRSHETVRRDIRSALAVLRTSLAA